jgi:hypothetical protein
LAEQGILSQHFILLGSLGHFPEKLVPPTLLHLSESIQMPLRPLQGPLTEANVVDMTAKRIRMNFSIFIIFIFSEKIK